ncbi:hypothetical protein FPV67DRAFT_440810 [Lyophyllum atratum]|nr:hypothetical protein FPV67DRAFT_440810 [Lyophyllum atratum]
MNSPALPSTPRRHLIAPIPLRAAADLHSARTREFQNIPSPSPTSSKSKWSNRIGGAVRRASSMFKGTRTETAPSSSTPSNGPYPPGYVPYPYPGPIIPQGGQLQGGLFAPGFIPYPSLPPLPICSAGTTTPVPSYHPVCQTQTNTTSLLSSLPATEDHQSFKSQPAHPRLAHPHHQVNILVADAAVEDPVAGRSGRTPPQLDDSRALAYPAYPPEGPEVPQSQSPS